MKQKHITVTALVALAFSLSGCGGGSDGTSTNTSDARYKVTFQSAWNASDFPTAFPTGKEHFSGLIGATHTRTSSIWKTGTKASAGMKLMAETGKKDTLKSEISANSAMSMIDGGGIAVGSSTVSLEFSISKSKPLLTLSSMVAPSPDWFVGVSGLNLYDEAKKEWVANKTVTLKVYDGGTDSGTSFASANLPTSPTTNISILTEPEVDINNGLQSTSGKAIGTFSIQRL